LLFNNNQNLIKTAFLLVDFFIILSSDQSFIFRIGPKDPVRVSRIHVDFQILKNQQDNRDAQIHDQYSNNLKKKEFFFVTEEFGVIKGVSVADKLEQDDECSENEGNIMIKNVNHKTSKKDSSNEEHRKQHREGDREIT